jgi:hypothetical protein
VDFTGEGLGNDLSCAVEDALDRPLALSDFIIHLHFVLSS